MLLYALGVKRLANKTPQSPKVNSRLVFKRKYLGTNVPN